MELKEAITGRRSIRRFKSSDISEEQIFEILESARLAPSEKNRQPWKLIVLKDSK